jgi:hypothetical protein
MQVLYVSISQPLRVGLFALHLWLLLFWDLVREELGIHPLDPLVLV